MRRRTFTLTFLVALTVIIYGCSGGPPETITSTAADTTQAPSSELPLWQTAELKDIATGNIFTIGSFDKPVLLESFAVWCPVCTRQQQESKKLEALTDSIISVSLDTDPNEDEARVQEHITRNGFDWYYTVASKEVTNSLIDDFGISFVNVPLAPMVVLCPDQSTHRLRNGVKSADELKDSVEQKCGPLEG